jgi:hypothetical protein
VLSARQRAQLSIGPHRSSPGRRNDRGSDSSIARGCDGDARTVALFTAGGEKRDASAAFSGHSNAGLRHWTTSAGGTSNILR